MAATPEGKVKKKLDKMLKTFTPELWYFPPQAGPFGSSGVPDRIVCYKGWFIGIEVKADASKKMTALQINCKWRIEAAGGAFFLIYDDTTIDVVQQYLRNINLVKGAKLRLSELGTSNARS